MTANKSKVFLLASVICFFLMSVDFLIMPISNNIEKDMRWFEILTGILFWLPLIAGIVLQVILSLNYKKNINKDMADNKLFGAISFFKNKIAAVFDVISVISLITFIAMLIFTSATSYFCYILISLFVFSFCMHCILNGKIFNSLLVKK